MMRAVVFIISVLFVFAVSAENIYESSDSVRVEQLMRKMQCFDGEKTLLTAVFLFCSKQENILKKDAVHFISELPGQPIPKVLLK